MTFIVVVVVCGFAIWVFANCAKEFLAAICEILSCISHSKGTLKEAKKFDKEHPKLDPRDMQKRDER